MSVSRLISLVLLLQARGRTTATELADRLEVSVRTVYRDLDALSLAGVPVLAERGPGGGCELLDGYQTRLTGMSGDEAELLFLSSVSGPAAELGRGALLAGAQLKLLAALPHPLRAQASAANQRVHVDLRDWFQGAEATPHLGALTQAVWEQRRIEVAYRRGSGDLVQRRLQPLGLVIKAGVWYLVAAVAPEGTRAYRVSRITELGVEELRFERPASFDLAEFWTGWTADFEASRPSCVVTVRAGASGYRTLMALLGGQVRHDLRRGRNHLVTLDLERPEFARTHLLSLGPGVEVLAPQELRRAVARASRELARTYRRRSGSAAEPSRDGKLNW
ncbi:MAG: helix-turn-helix transcriptional regulator [Streptosporangiaceae bacterium]